MAGEPATNPVYGHAADEGRFWPTYVRESIPPLLFGLLAGGALTVTAGMATEFYYLITRTGMALPDAVGWVLLALVGGMVGLIVGGLQRNRLPGVYRPGSWWIPTCIALYALGWATASSNVGAWPHIFGLVMAAIGAVVVPAAILGLVLRIVLKRSGPEQQES